MDMFLVEVDVTMGIVQRLTDDEVTDLIETLIDELDHLPVDPSVGSSRNGDDLDITVGVVVDDDGSLDAMAHGLAIIKTAFHAVGVNTANLGVPQGLRDLRSRVSVLQPSS